MEEAKCDVGAEFQAAFSSTTAATGGASASPARRRRGLAHSSLPGPAAPGPTGARLGRPRRPSRPGAAYLRGAAEPAPDGGTPLPVLRPWEARLGRPPCTSREGPAMSPARSSTAPCPERPPSNRSPGIVRPSKAPGSLRPHPRTPPRPIVLPLRPPKASPTIGPGRIPRLRHPPT